ncbi:DUF5359 family protein [Salirhabdus salicampi]|uniref:DUF5359 family protein n=1 Tax=Salirhabdus salicampi TaxID=476102 RepID=UPI00346317DF
MVIVKKLERILNLFLICHAILLLITQWVLLNTDINMYFNPIYEYIGVFEGE